MSRSDALRPLIDCISVALPATGRAVVAIDGSGGSGKTTLTGEVASGLARSTIQMHADDFLNDPVIRRARGPLSPEGHWLDGYDLRGMRDAVRAAAAGHAIVLMEGIFLHRDALRDLWDFSIYLHTPFAIAAQRMVDRGTVQSIDDRRFERWFGSQRIYFRAVEPWACADLVIDNTEIDAPKAIDAAQVANLIGEE